MGIPGAIFHACVACPGITRTIEHAHASVEHGIRKTLHPRRSFAFHHNSNINSA